MLKYISRFAIVCVLFSIISCDNEPLDGNFGETGNEFEDPNANATFQVRLDDGLYQAEEILAVFNEDGLLISGRNGVQEFSVNIANPAIGSYELSNSSEDVFVTYTSNRNLSQPFYTGTSGQLNITNYNEEIGLISGNFQGVLSEFIGLAENIQMSSGIFQEVRFLEVIEVEEPEEPADDGGDTGEEGGEEGEG